MVVGLPRWSEVDTPVPRVTPPVRFLLVRMPSASHSESAEQPAPALAAVLPPAPAPSVERSMTPSHFKLIIALQGVIAVIAAAAAATSNPHAVPQLFEMPGQGKRRVDASPRVSEQAGVPFFFSPPEPPRRPPHRSSSSWGEQGEPQLAAAVTAALAAPHVPPLRTMRIVTIFFFMLR